MNAVQKQIVETATKIEALKAAVKQYAPEGWSALQGCFMDMSTMSTTGDHISISPTDPKAGGSNYSERKQTFYPVAKQVLATLKGNGFKARMDGWTVYIFP